MKRGWRRCGLALAALTVLVMNTAVANSAVSGAVVVGAGPAGTVGRVGPFDFVNGLSCYGPAFCMAAGQQSGSGPAEKTLAERWNGRSWRLAEPPDPGPASRQSLLNAVSCWNRSGCLALGADKANLADVWNGARWRFMRPPKPRRGVTDLNGLSCPAASHCLIVGDHETVRGGVITAQRPAALDWRAGRWHALRAPSPAGGALPELDQVGCSTPARCLAIGDYQVDGGTLSMAEAWNGRAWRLLTLPQPPGQNSGPANLAGVSCTHSGPCMTVGYYDANDSTPNGTEALSFAATWDGGQLHEVKAPQPGTSSTLFGASCGALTRCMTIGYFVTAAGDQPNISALRAGTAWRISRLPPVPVNNYGDGYNFVSCETGRVCMSLGTESTSSSTVNISAIWNGRRWLRVRFLNPGG